MAVQYNKLWKLLIDRKMKKSALTSVAGVSASTIAKLSHDEYVSLEILERICRALHCDIGDVVEVTKEAGQ
ncbi:MAG TPA: helix-turn-helix transcriptional regulator [Candidatus Limivicinus faecipullorum]|nr:helix-turn-helix transcriptional regulator [Candidatus Limivicinus faecipullorum]